MSPSDLTRIVLHYVGSSCKRAGILTGLATWGVLLVILYQHQSDLLHLIGAA